MASNECGKLTCSHAYSRRSLVLFHVGADVKETLPALDIANFYFSDMNLQRPASKLSNDLKQQVRSPTWRDPSCEMTN